MIPSEQAHLLVAAGTHPGMSGKNNEDRYAVQAYTLSQRDPTPALFAIVADGIGGHQAGEIAAEIVVESICRAVGQSDGSDPIATLERAIVDAGQAVHTQAQNIASQTGMGSTCACVWVIGDRLYTASVGDSRIYLLRKGKIQQLTIDHTWVQEAIEHGIITPEQARGHPRAHVIRRYLGSKQPTEADFRLMLGEHPHDPRALSNQGMRLRPGDQLVLCSDGLTDLVEDHEILAALQRHNLQSAIQHLINLANERGGHDNITVVALGVPADFHPKSSAQRKLTCAALTFFGLLLTLLIAVAIYTFWPTGGPQPTVTLAPATPQPALIVTLPTETPLPLPPTATLPVERPILPAATYTPWPTATGVP